MIQTLKIEDVARAVVFDDDGAEFFMLDIMRILQIALKKTVGLNCLIDGAIEIDLGNSHMLHCTVRQVKKA